MGGDLLVPLVTLAALVLLVVALVGALGVRRTLLSRDGGTFDCSVRRDGPHRLGPWSLGFARYEADRLDWFRAFSMNLRPSRSLSRSRLVILDKSAATGEEGHSVLPNWVIVTCAYGTFTIDLAMSAADYTGLATWLESAPPGEPAQVS